MNVTMINHEIYMATLSETEVLTKIEGPGACDTFIGTREGVDIIIIADATTGHAIVVEPCSGDAEYGGSVHDHARALMGHSGVTVA